MRKRGGGISLVRVSGATPARSTRVLDRGGESVGPLPDPCFGLWREVSGTPPSAVFWPVVGRQWDPHGPVFWSVAGSRWTPPGARGLTRCAVSPAPPPVGARRPAGRSGT